MDRSFDRRRFLLGLAAVPALPSLAADRPARASRARRAAVPPHFPHQDPVLVQAAVGASHRDLDRVREMVEARPELAKASWDWGFGDWESALGAASHVGRPDIAEYLIAHGARPDLFTWAMQGRVDVVRAAVRAAPGVEAVPGPHGITLLAHARAGGDAAALVLEYLQELGTADPRPLDVALTAEQRAALVGEYAFGSEAADRLVITERREALQVTAPDGGARNLLHQGGGEFHPAGAPSVRLRFDRLDGPAGALTLIDAEFVLEARKVG